MNMSLLFLVGEQKGFGSQLVAVASANTATLFYVITTIQVLQSLAQSSTYAEDRNHRNHTSAAWEDFIEEICAKL